MSDTSDLIGQVRKLDGRPVVIIGVNGDDVQVDHWAGSPWTPIVHVDRLGEMPPWIWTDERLAVLRQQAVERLGVWNDARALALGTLSLIHAFERREKCAEDVERGLAEEGKALDDVVRERDEARREWDALRLALDNSQAECRELRTAHEQALRERDEALRIRDDARMTAQIEISSGVSAIREAFNEANVKGFSVDNSTSGAYVIASAADAIREFGILNRELSAVNTALQPVAGKGETLSACVARLVKRLAEQDAELSNVRHELANVLQSNDALAHERDTARAEVKTLSVGAVEPVLNPTVRNFDSEYLRKTLELPMCADESVMVDRNRWSIIYDCFFRTDDLPEGYAWKSRYSEGATENQYEEPWEHEDEVKATLVRRGTKTVNAWIPAVMPEPSSEPETQAPIAEMAVTNGDGDELAESIADFREASAAVKESLQGVIDGMTELVAMTSQDEPKLDNLSIRAKQVLDHLRATGPQRGEQIRKHFGLGSSDWNKVKGELLDAKVIRKFGEARGAQYEAIA